MSHTQSASVCAPQPVVTDPRPAPELTAGGARPQDVVVAPPASGREDEEDGKMKGDGELREDEIGDHLSDLGTVTGAEHVYRSLSITQGLSPKGKSALCSYIYLQNLEVPFSKIKDLSCVSFMPHLITLDASHNDITDFFGFQPPRNLKEVNLSHNHMSEMKDLSAYPSLRRLNLDYNYFREIRGLQRCVSLTHLSLAHNRLYSTRGLNSLALRVVSLKANQIQTVENMDCLRALQTLDLSYNRIQSLSGLQNLDYLGVVNLEGNLVREIKEACHLHDLPLLRVLNLQENPVQDQPYYRLAVTFLLQRLTTLDQKEVTVEEKVSAMDKFDPPAEVVAAKDHMVHLMYHLMQPQILLNSTLPGLDTPYPMLVLTGPQACGKRELAHKLCQHFAAYGTCHTTRSPYFGEVDGCDYHFVSEEEFQRMTHMGKFMETIRYREHHYGLSRDAIEAAARDGLACCVHMELEGVRSLKMSHLEPRYVLLVPTDLEAYASRLRQRGLYSHAQVQAAVARVALYVTVNRGQPGYFDNIIPCDDLQEAYTMLSQVVRDYLGLDEQMAGKSTPATSVGDSPAAEKERDRDSRVHCNKVEARMVPQTTSTETSALQRRMQLAREAVAGQSAPAYTQLFCRSSVTAPGGGRAVSPYQQERRENSSPESRPSSGLSTLSLARASLEDVCSGLEPPGGLGLDTEQPADPSTTPDRGQLASRGSSSRPGADAKPILPPIPSGRRTSERPASEPLAGWGGVE
ncbi:leucine-rich repeat and guanylate kinase domain-containing protein [Brienomyrus brachyistius]|uniref:leucine-rich repeat and guanylate kinase domain-containing protein n=1 Tax=Brienomyrus brachyistius TaxID=42636 RepID=UPI0020B1E99D|nr:leucine-rich repeat and guanylate kinase domain-containing protein [Brienomyrus brachyistius]